MQTGRRCVGYLNDSSDGHALDNVGWRLKVHILGMMYSPKKYTNATIFDSLLNACNDFGLWPNNAKGKIPQSEQALSYNRVGYFTTKHPSDRSVLMSYRGNDVSARGEKDNIWDCNRCVCPSLSIAAEAPLKSPTIQELLCRWYSQLHHIKARGLWDLLQSMKLSTPRKVQGLRQKTNGGQPV